MLGDILNAVGVPNQALLFRRLQGLQHLVNGRAEIKRLAEIAAKVHRPSPPVIFYVADVDALYDRALGAGYQPATVPRDAEWGERFFHLIDPDGHELSFARPLPKVSVQ
jgi:uncharacterized glyoxalase superfamily protein PhnB